MAARKQPKVILFDIGGVCVISPMQAILDYELGLGIPPGWVNYSISKTKPDGFFHRLERGDIKMDDAFYAGFNRDLHCPQRWQAFYDTQRAKNPALPRDLPPLPRMNGKWLFNEMMTRSTTPDPWMYPALQNLKKSDRFVLAAVSNTVIFPPDHPLHRSNFFDDPIRSLFDVFVSSAHVGLRKPDPRIYQYTLDEVNKFADAHAHTEKGKALGLSEGVEAGQIVFLDDIGENLKGGKKLGFGTIKVPLGKAFEAVDELEAITGLQIAGDHPRTPLQPEPSGPKAKI